MATILGIYQSRNDVDKAISELNKINVQTKNISVMARDTVVSNDSDKVDDVVGGAASGAGTGAVVGGLAGLLVGIGAITVPGIGALLIGGPLAAALGLTGAAAATASGAATGAVAGGIIGSLVGLGFSKEDAEIYENRIKEGAIILAAKSDDATGENDIREIFEMTGADQIRSIV